MTDDDDPPTAEGSASNAGDTRLPAARPATRAPKSRGWFGDDDPPADAGSDDGPGWLDRLTQTLTDLAADISSVTVRTYVADDVGEATRGGREIGDVGQLRAWTRIAIDGDTDVCVPTRDGKVDRALWQLHQQVVDQAQTHRTAMVETLVGSVSGLWTAKKK